MIWSRTVRRSAPACRAQDHVYHLADHREIARQDDAATVQRREEIAEQFTLGLLRPDLLQQLARKLVGVSVAGHTADTIGLQ